MSLLTLFIILFATASIWQLIRIAELTSELQGAPADDVPDSKTNSYMSALFFIFIVFFLAFAFWMFIQYKDNLLPGSASVHGLGIDTLFKTTAGLITVVFVVTHFLLGLFAYRYYSKSGRRAFFYHHNNKLEFYWTLIPATVLTGLIIFGIVIWTGVMSPPPQDALHIEIYGKQFQWVARYSGKDKTLGNSNYQMIAGINTTGIDTSDKASWDDIISSELHLPAGKPVLLSFRSQDVIHSAYLPHFRVQMNCVPGMTTRFHFIPDKTTVDMRMETGDANFDYYLICNKICGAAHYNMKMTVVVEAEAEFNKWIGEQKTLLAERMKN